MENADVRIIGILRCLLLENNEATHSVADINLTHNTSIVTQKFLDDRFKSDFGFMAESKLKEGHALAYRIKPIDTAINNQWVFERELLIQANNFRGTLGSLDLFLWLIKDNSVYISDVYGSISKGANYHPIALRPFERFTTCTGESVNVRFSNKEIEDCFDIINKYNSLAPPPPPTLASNKNQKKKVNVDISPAVDSYNSKNRIERALLFIRAARMSEGLLYKIAMYAPALECLFSTNKEELTFRVSQRVGYYLGSNKDERLNIFNNVKNAYNLRSRYLHGDLVDDALTHDKLIDLAKNIDTIARNAIVKAICFDSHIFLLEKDPLEKHFNSIVFQ